MATHTASNFPVYELLFLFRFWLDAHPSTFKKINWFVVNALHLTAEIYVYSKYLQAASGAGHTAGLGVLKVMKGLCAMRKNNVQRKEMMLTYVIKMKRNAAVDEQSSLRANKEREEDHESLFRKCWKRMDGLKKYS